MAPNNDVKIPINLGDPIQRMKELKIQLGQFRSEDDGANSQGKLLHNKLVAGKKVVFSELHEAVEKGNVDNFLHVLEQVCTKNKVPLSDVFDHVTWEGDSLLHVAAHQGKEQIAILIARHFPDLLTRRNARGDTPLHIAARSNNCTIVRFIISQYGIIEKSKHDEKKDRKITREENECGNTPLHEAVNSKKFDAVKELIHADQEVVHYCLNKSKQSPLYMAVVSWEKEKNEEILNLLLEIPFINEDHKLPQCLGNSPLHAAILESKFSIRSRDKHAVSSKSDLIRKILKKRPELVYLRDEDGGTPLHYAAYIGYAEGFNILLEHSSETLDLTVLEGNKEGHLPIHIACKRGHVEVVEKFFQHKWHFDPFALLNKKGHNILHVAANNGQINVVKYLLKYHKIDQFINEKDHNGNTPLHLASKNLFPEVIYHIAQHKKIDLELLNNNGLTAGDVVERKQMSIRKFLANRVVREVGVPMKANNMLHSQLSQNTPKPNKSLKDLLDTFLVVATLMVTVTFAAGFTVPGGVYSSGDPNPGKAIFAHEPFFWVFTTFNMVAMYSSVIACALMLLAMVFDHKLAARATIVAMGCLVFAFLLVPVSFLAAVRLVVDNNSVLAILATVIGSLYSSLFLFSLIGFFPIGIHFPPFRQVGRIVLHILIKSIVYDAKPGDSSSKKANKDNDKAIKGKDKDA